MSSIIIKRDKGDNMRKKIISVSKKRQITLPLKYYEHLGFENEVECSLENDSIVIRPLKRNTTEFSVEILKDLVSQGYTGEELIKQFELQNDNIKKAINTMLEEADAIAAGEIKSATFDEIFN